MTQGRSQSGKNRCSKCFEYGHQKGNCPGGPMYFCRHCGAGEREPMPFDGMCGVCGIPQIDLEPR